MKHMAVGIVLFLLFTALLGTMGLACVSLKARYYGEYGETGSLKVTQHNFRVDLKGYAVVKLKIENISEQTLDRAIVTVDFYDEDGKLLVARVACIENLPPDQSAYFEINSYKDLELVDGYGIGLSVGSQAED
jgi:hypothetical protein